MDEPTVKPEAMSEAPRGLLHTAATRHLFHLDLPPLTNKQRQSRPKHFLMMRE